MGILLMASEKLDFGGMKRKELQALCKKHNIPANLTNAEMAKRLKARSPVEEKVGILKRSIEKANENVSDIEVRLPKKVKFDSETQILEFEKSEVKYSEIKGRGRRKSLISKESIHGVTKKMDGKKNVTDDILNMNFVSSTYNVAPENRGSNGDQMVTRRSLRSKKAEDDRMGEMEDLMKGANKSVTDIDDEVVKKRGSEPLNAQPDKVLRRSKRNAVLTGDSKSLTGRGRETEVVERGRPITDDLPADDNVNMEAKVCLSTGENLRRSKRHALRDETLVTLDNLVGETNGKKETRRSTLDAKRNKNAAPEMEKSEKPQKEKGIVKEMERLKGPNVAGKNSTFEEITNNVQCSSLSDQMMFLEKECHPVGEKNMRKSRTASKHELPIILENVVAVTKDRQEARKQRKGSVNNVQEEETGEVDHPFIIEPVRRSARNANINKEAAPEPIENVPQEKRSRSIKPRKEKNNRSKNPQMENTTYIPSLELSELTISEHEGPPIGESTRSETHDSIHEPLVTLYNVDGDGDKGIEEANIQMIVSNDVQQEESTESDKTLFHESVQESVDDANRSEGAAPGLLEEIASHEEKQKLKEVLEIKDNSEAPMVAEASTLFVDLITEEHYIKDQASFYVQLTKTGNIDNMEYQNDDKTEVIVEDNIYKGKKPEEISNLESYCRIENSPMEVNTVKQKEYLEQMKIYPSESVELQNDHTDSKSVTSPFDGKASAAEIASMSQSNKSQMVEHVLLLTHFSSEDVAVGLSEEIGLHEEKEMSKELHKIKEQPETPSMVEDWMTKEHSIKDEPTIYVQLTTTENAGSFVYNKTEVFVEDSMHKGEKPESISSLDSYRRIENSPTDQRKHLELTELYPSESVESLSDHKNSKSDTVPFHGGKAAAVADHSSMSLKSNKTEISAGSSAFTERRVPFDKSHVGEISEIFTDIDHCIVTNESYDIDEPEDIQTRQVLFHGEQISSLDNVIHDNMISPTKMKGSLEQNCIETSRLTDVSEKDPSSGPKKLALTEDTCDDMNEVVYGIGHLTHQPELDDKVEVNNVVNSVSTSAQSANLLSMKMDAFDAEKMNEIHRNINQELTCGKIERSEEDNCVGYEYNSSDNCVASLTIPLTLSKDENVNVEDYSTRHADILGPSHEYICTGFESGNTKSLSANFNLEGPDVKEDSVTIAENEDYCHLEYGMQKQNQDTEGHVSHYLKANVEKDSRERCSGGGTISIIPAEKHTDEPTDYCPLVVALPAFVLPPEENTVTPEICVLDSVHARNEDSNTSKQGKELSSLFATPVPISSSMKETQIYKYEGQISTPTEMTSARKDEQSCLSPVFLRSDEQESVPEKKEETDVGLHPSGKYEIINEDELDQEKGQIHFDVNINAGLGIQNFADPHLAIGHDIAETMNFPEGSLQCATFLDDMKLKVLVESRAENIEETDGDAFGECNASVEQEPDAEKEEIHSIHRNRHIKKIDHPQCSIGNDHLLGLEESDVFGSGQSPGTETAHDILKHDSLINNGEMIALLEMADKVQKSDDGDVREYKTLLVGHEDEGDYVVQVADELDMRIVDSHSPICELSVEWKGSDVDNIQLAAGELLSIVESTHDAPLQTDSSVKGAEMMDMVETGPEEVQETDDNNGVGRKYNDEEKNGTHFMELIAMFDQEMEESSHAVDSFSDLGSANTKFEVATPDPINHEVLMNDVETMARFGSGEEPVQVTVTKYMASIEKEEHKEDIDDICSKGNFLELEQKSSNPEDFKECYVADTVALSSDLNSPEKSSLRIAFREATKNQVAFSEPVAVQAEETDIASQDLMELTETEHDKAEEISIESFLQEKNSFAAGGGGTSQEEQRSSPDTFPHEVNDLKTVGPASSESVGAYVADNSELIHLKCNEYLSPRTDNTCDSQLEDGTTDIMVVTDAEQISKTTKEVDGGGTSHFDASVAQVESMSIVRKNVRTILIHGTPNKMQGRSDMKENMVVNSKLDNVGNFTSVRPAKKRPALKDIRND